MEGLQSVSALRAVPLPSRSGSCWEPLPLECWQTLSVCLSPGACDAELADEEQAAADLERHKAGLLAKRAGR